MNKDTSILERLVNESSKILIVQADNPDADSLGSALALEQIISSMGKECSLYCAVDIPTYLHYLTGWSRVDKTLPREFDLAVIVDASTTTLLDKIKLDSNYNRFEQCKKIVLDHHETVQDIIEADFMINDSSISSTGELIYNIADKLEWKLSIEACECIFASIMGDTQGLSNNLANAQTFRVVAQLIDNGIDRLGIDEKRRSYSRMPPTIYDYKATLIRNTKFANDNSLAYVVVDQKQINTYSPLYNPAAVIQSDMLQVEGVLISMVIKTYDDGKITAAIRCNNGAPIAAKVAETFGGGGHSYASGFKCTDSRSVDEIIRQSIDKVTELLNNIHHETI